MRAWKRTRARAATTQQESPLPPPDELERLVDEGMMIARSALRMAVKNRLIVAALRSPDDFDEESLLLGVRDDVESLAEEKTFEADRVSSLANRAARRQGRATYHDDYRRRDVRALSTREHLNTTMAERLRALLADTDELRSLVSEAREAALDDMLQSRLAAAQPFHRDPDYLVERPERLKDLTRDIGVLYRRQKAKLGDRID